MARVAVTGHETDRLNSADGEPIVGVTERRRPLSAFGRQLLAFVAAIRRLLGLTIFASLTRRIVFLNLVALAILVVGILYLNQWRAGLIDARVQSLRVQGEIIAAAIAASATVDSDV